MNELNREEKAQVVASVVERLERTQTVVAADFRGLNVAQISELRLKLRDADAEMTVVKNTLSRRAADQAGHQTLVPYLTGPTGLVWVNGDVAAAAKVLDDFAKAHATVFSVRGGIMDGADLDPGVIKQLASLPSRDVLLAKLAGGVAAPLTGLAGGLNALLSTLARTLSAVAGSGQLATGEASASAADSSASDEPASDTAADESTSDESADAQAHADGSETEAAADAAPDGDEAPDSNDSDSSADADESTDGAADGDAETPES